MGRDDFMNMRPNVVLLALTLILAADSFAGDDRLKVASISVERAIFMTDEGKQAFEELSRKLEPKQKELRALNAEIESLKQKLDSRDPKIGDTDRANLRSQIDSKQKLLNAALQKAKKGAQDQQNEIAKHILGKMAAIVINVATENKLDAVVDTSVGDGHDSAQLWPKGPVLWFGPNV